MADHVGRAAGIAYCTNVHAADNGPELREALSRHAAAVRQDFIPNGFLHVGLWLPAATARELRAPGAAAAFGTFLVDHGLRVATFNGFPFGGFHDDIVKHAVYRPDWTDRTRLAYTVDLAQLLSELIPEGASAGVSTVPLGWAGTDPGACAVLLHELIDALERIERRSGRWIHVDLEPEPGCALQDSAGMVDFFQRHLTGDRARRYLQVCHDVCHAAVMFEDQGEALSAYGRAGLAVGKVQVSSALAVRFVPHDAAGNRIRRAALEAFGERRYLHQTTIACRGVREFHDDLPAALARHLHPSGEWRVHFHVPVYLPALGPLGTTSDCIAAAVHHPVTAAACLEVETYAWTVLPSTVDRPRLAEGIARELRWLTAVLEGGA